MNWMRTIVIPLLLCSTSSVAQERTEAAQDTVQTREVIIGADLLEREVVDGENVRRLVGNVTLRQEDTRLWARRATQFPNRRDILFTGEVLVVERGDSLRADSVLYNERTKVGRARGNVRLSDGDVIVYAPSGLYFTREKRAQFTEGVTLIDSSATLRSREGEYWSDDKRAEFYGDVVLDEDRTHLEADSVSYFRETDVSIARGRVFIEHLGEEEEVEAEAEPDSLSRTLLFGDRAYNDEMASFSRMEGRPLLVQLRSDSTGSEVDTLLIRAVQLDVSRSDSLRRLVAIDSVRIWQSDLAAVADSVVYDRLTSEDDSVHEEVRLFRDPLAWFKTNQVSGDTLLIDARAGSVDTLLMRNNAFVARMDTSLERVQQLKGRHLTALFRNDSLQTLSIGPQAEAINFLGDENDEPAGAVKMSADRITFYFEGDEASRISAVRDPESTYYSEDLLPQEFSLDGYQWLPERRPTREGLLEDIVLRDRWGGVDSSPLQEMAKSDDARPALPQDDARHEPPANDEHDPSTSASRQSLPTDNTTSRGD